MVKRFFKSEELEYTLYTTSGLEKYFERKQISNTALNEYVDNCQYILENAPDFFYEIRREQTFMVINTILKVSFILKSEGENGFLILRIYDAQYDRAITPWQGDLVLVHGQQGDTIIPRFDKTQQALVRW